MDLEPIRRTVSRARTAPTLRRLYERNPRFQPLVREAYAALTRREPPTFFGWLMTTHHQVPWVDDHRWATFRQATETVKQLTFTDPTLQREIDALLWRHWNIAYATTHALDHLDGRDFVGVECGVHDGITAYFALHELADAASEDRVDGYRFHLYDAWAPMRDEELAESERVRTGWYAELAVDRTRGNLAPWGEQLAWHPGYIPATLDEGDAPQHVSYLHIDLNAAGPTVAACEFFWPRLRPGSVVVFDDYGWLEYDETKRAIDDFLVGRPGTLFKLPTGQAMFFC